MVLVTAYIAHQANIAVIQTQIQYIEKKIDSIDNNFVEKELLELQLKDVIAQINSSYSITLNDIKWQLQVLSDKIDSLEEPNE